MKSSASGPDRLRIGVAAVVVIGISVAYVVSKLRQTETGTRIKLSAREIDRPPQGKVPAAYESISVAKWLRIDGPLPLENAKNRVSAAVIGDDGERVDAWLIGAARGSTYALVGHSYAKAPLNPRLQLTSGKEVLLEKRLSELPQAKRVLPATTKGDRRVGAKYVELVMIGGFRKKLLKITLSHPVPAGQYAVVSLLKTSYGVVGAPSQFTNSWVLGPGESIAHIGGSNLEHAEEAEIDVQYIARHSHTDRVVFKGGRLEEVDGRPVFQHPLWSRQSTASGFDAQLAAQKIRSVGRALSGISEVTIPAIALNPRDPSRPVTMEGPGVVPAEINLVSPKPEEIGVQRIKIAGKVFEAKGQVAPVPRKGPVTVILDITGDTGTPVGKFTAVVPIVKGPQMGAAKRLALRAD